MVLGERVVSVVDPLVSHLLALYLPFPDVDLQLHFSSSEVFPGPPRVLFLAILKADRDADEQ